MPATGAATEGRAQPFARNVVDIRSRKNTQGAPAFLHGLDGDGEVGAPSFDVDHGYVAIFCGHVAIG